MKLPPGEYFISLRHPMYGEHRLCAVLGDNEEVTLDGDLAARERFIRVTANPPDVIVHIDGRYQRPDMLSEKTDFAVIPGLHKVQVWKSLYKPAIKLVQVDSNKWTTVKVDLSPAEHFTNSVGMEFVKIPVGEFMMGFVGSPEYHADRICEKERDFLNYGELVYQLLFKDYPQHLVKITKPFFMQTTEVTNAQWDKVMGTHSPVKEALKPKISVSIEDAKEFIAKLNQIDKGEYRYRLPTEAEWEYAARAGTKGFYFFGNSITTDQANFRGKLEMPVGWSFGESRIHTMEVKSFIPNPWGLYNMHGNASELCADWFDGFYYTYSPVKDPMSLGEEDGDHVGRGGSSYSSWEDLMSGERGRAGISFLSDKDPNNGLRLVAEKISD